MQSIIYKKQKQKQEQNKTTNKNKNILSLELSNLFVSDVILSLDQLRAT